MKLKERSSNFELLRIIAMIMIVVYHITLHCISVQLERPDLGSVYQKPIFFRRLFLLQGVMPFGKIGVALFVLISGYFLVEKGNQINLQNVFVKLLLQAVYSVVFLLVGGYLYFKLFDLPIESDLWLGYFNQTSWFIGFYLAIILIATLYGNQWLLQCSQKQYKTFLVIAFAVFSMAWCGELLDDLAKGLRTLVYGVFLFALGGYIKKYNPFARIRVWVLWGICVIVYVLLYLGYYMSIQTNINKFNANLIRKEEIQEFVKFPNHNLVSLILAIVLFEIFRRLKIPNIKFINRIAASTFMIYLMHDNYFFYMIWDKVNWIKLLKSDITDFVLIYLRSVGIVFAIGFAAYYIYFYGGYLLSKIKFIFVKKEKS